MHTFKNSIYVNLRHWAMSNILHKYVILGLNYANTRRKLIYIRGFFAIGNEDFQRIFLITVS